MDGGTETLQALLTRLEIKSWDLILVGDGSGSMWGYPIGWGCVALEHDSLERKIFYGSMNDGTVNMAELLAYLAPLQWYAGRVEEQRKVGAFEIKNVHIITDSSYVQSKGEAAGAITMKRNATLWASFELFARQGFKLHWHWLPAYHEKPDQAAALNHYADVLSKVVREVLKGLDLPGELSREKGLDPYKFNPWE